MGRPPLKLELTSVRLSEGAKERITALVGTYGMAQFIREAVDTALAAEEKRRDEQRPAPKASDDPADA